MTNERESIEIGKMLSKMPDANIIYNPYNKRYCCITNPIETKKDGDSIDVKFEVTTSREEWFKSRYQAIKYAYFYEVLNYSPDSTESFDLDLDDETFDKLLKISDEMNITMDEVVINLLQEYIDTYEEKENNEKY